MEELFNDIFSIKTDEEFSEIALKIFNFQYQNNQVYREYVNLIGIKPENVNQIDKIPFLPISFFKTHKVITGEKQPELYFQSSGTTGQIRSQNWVVDTQKYTESFTKTFDLFYGDSRNYCFLALLPSYLEQEHSSLVFMVDYFIKNSKCEKSAFFLDNFKELSNILDELEAKGKKIILFGVSYALMDFAKFYNKPLKNTIIIETGGMKGRREELSKNELHKYLKKYLQVDIHSEYGMTELFSQAYSQENELFRYPPWMKILIRDRYDPFSYLPVGKTGGINIIDLANIDTCCFIETQDMGTLYANNSFKLAGRFDIADIRGCNLLIEG